MLSYLAAAAALNIAPAADEPVANDPRVERLEKDNAKLEKRLEALEAEAKKNEKAEEARRKDEGETKQKAETLETKNAALEDRVEELEQKQEQTEARLKALEFLSGRIGGYLDVGFFWVDGNGSGIRPDLQYQEFPEYRGRVPDEWVFMGDPLSTMINSRGDVADAGGSLTLDADPIQSGNNPTFMVNALNLAPQIGLGNSVRVNGLIDFLPRGRTFSQEGTPSFGDYVDIKLANVQWHTPVRAFDWDLYAGKIDSVFGREYRYQEAPDRLMVTPSLMCRYTCGRPVGLSSRMKLLRSRALTFNVALTNGNSHYEAFGTTSEQETNVFKTVTGRVAYKIPVGAGLEVGASGMVGAEDLQPRNDVLQWQYGFDVNFQVRGFELSGEFIQGKIDGYPADPLALCSQAQCLDVLSAYGLVGYRITNWLMPLFRTDWRDAQHRQFGLFAYESELIRFTPGVRFELGEHVIAKAEYTFNKELGRIPTFRNDVFTSSLIARF